MPTTSWDFAADDKAALSDDSGVPGPGLDTGPSLLHRRIVLVGALASLVAAPSIVRAASLMPVKAVVWVPIAPNLDQIKERAWAGFVERLAYRGMENVLKLGWTPRRAAPFFGGMSESQMRRCVAYARRNGFL